MNDYAQDNEQLAAGGVAFLIVAAAFAAAGLLMLALVVVALSQVMHTGFALLLVAGVAAAWLALPGDRKTGQSSSVSPLRIR